MFTYICTYLSISFGNNTMQLAFDTHIAYYIAVIYFSLLWKFKNSTGLIYFNFKINSVLNTNAVHTKICLKML